MTDKAEKIWHEYRRLMMYIANGFFGGANAAEDAVSDAFVKILRNIDRFGEVPSPRSRGLVIIITKNCCRDIMRKSEPEYELRDDAAREPAPADIVISAESVGRITECIGRLNDSYADILRLKYIYEMNDTGISSVLGISAQNTRTRLSRARAALTAELRREGIL
ncbi:MAG: sigma-70 family RNA polymerase sigma factor [Eubacteriales bacterium]|jgi:RNA polymerase sigma-70 factor (ECF subfamily)|nr:sigma-70 family RNA polymerase sigma factor [Eubacteriales bacterium]